MASCNLQALNITFLALACNLQALNITFLALAFICHTIMSTRKSHTKDILCYSLHATYRQEVKQERKLKFAGA